MALEHSWAAFGRSWPLLGRSWAALGPLLAALGLLLAALGPLLGRSWAVHGRSWAALGRSWGLGRPWPYLGPQDRPRLPGEATRAARHRPPRPRERAETTYTGQSTSQRTFNRKRQRKKKEKHAVRQLHDRPSIDNIEEEIHRQNMLPVNFRPDRRVIMSTNYIALKR